MVSLANSMIDLLLLALQTVSHRVVPFRFICQHLRMLDISLDTYKD